MLLKEDLHIIGVASIIIASKFEDVKLIKKKKMIEEILNNKYTCEDVNIMEREILNNPTAAEEKSDLQALFIIFQMF